MTFLTDFLICERSVESVNELLRSRYQLAGIVPDKTETHV